MEYVASLLLFLTVFFWDAAQAFTADEPKVDLRVEKQIRSTGIADVYVRLNVPERNTENRDSWLKAIVTAERSVLEELKETDYKFTLREVPSSTLRMEISLGALSILRASSYVRRVDEVPKARNPVENIIIHPPEKK